MRAWQDAVDRAELELAEHRAAVERRVAARAAEGPRPGRCDCHDLDDHEGELAIAWCADPDCSFAARRCERHGGDLAVRAVVGHHHRELHAEAFRKPSRGAGGPKPLTWRRFGQLRARR